MENEIVANILELDPDNYLGELIEYAVDGMLLVLQTRYNPYYDQYTVDIFVDGIAVLIGHKLTTGIDLLGYFKDVTGYDVRIPRIRLIPVTLNDSTELIGIENYGNGSAIVVAPEEAYYVG